MSTLEYRLRDPDYKNWVKTGLCLNLVKEGLEKYADIKSKEFHNAVLASVAKIQTYQTSLCDNEKITFDNNNNGKTACNHAFCQDFLNAIVHIGIDPTQKFTIRKPNIDNCSVKLWPTDHWELAKLFMNRGQTSSQTNPSQTDLSGILNFLEHCQIPRNGIQNFQNIKKVRETRNSVMHTPDMKVSQAMYQTETQTMLDLLQDPNVLLGLPSAQHAASEIQKVLQSDFQIFLEDEIGLIKALITALKTDTDDTKKETEILRMEFLSMRQAGEEEKNKLQREMQQAEEEIKKVSSSLTALKKLVSEDKTLQEKIGREVKDLHSSLEQVKLELWSAHNEIKRRLDEVEQKVSALSARQANTESGEYEIKRRQDDIEQKVIDGAQERTTLYVRQTKIESEVEAMKTPTIGDEDCRKLRESLVEEYTRIYKDISLSPFGEELNDDVLRVPINEIYCDLRIVKIKDDRQFERKPERKSGFELLSNSHIDLDTNRLVSKPLKFSAGRHRRIIFSRRSTANTRKLNSYSEMFADTEIKNIVIKGEGGTGKSTWCKRLLHAWCQVQRRELGMEGASDEANSDLEKSLKRFDYLFYVTLRHVKYQSPLKDIFFSTGLGRLETKRKICEQILANQSENVLILLDGFDEYPFILDCQGLVHSTIVMTTRPWKYNVLCSRDNSFKVDAVSEIRGLTDRGVEELSRKAIASYTKRYPVMGLKNSNEKEQTEIYLGNIKSAGLSNSIKIPLKIPLATVA